MADVELSTLGSVIKTAYEAETNTNAYTDAEKSKLAGVEASADVTDTANVTAAGALMDSEVTNLAAVKAFDPADYATAAQGTTADAALPADGSGEMTGDLVFAEAADHSSTPGAGKGYLWVKSDTPSSLIFTDDAGTDYDLTAAGGGGDLWSDAVDSDIVPTGADGTYDLGTTTDRFAQTYTDTIWITDGDITASVADGASAVAFDFNNTATLSTSGAKLASFKNNGTEHFTFGLDDTEGFQVGTDSTAPTLKVYRNSNYGYLELGRRGVSSGFVVRATNGASTLYTTASGNAGAIALNSSGVHLFYGDLTADGNSSVYLGSENDSTQRTNLLQADKNTVRNRNGAHIRIKGGDGGATDRTGGNIYLTGGDNTGTGTKGVVVMDTEHTVATLPGTPAVGMMARVTDASAPAVGSTVSGGGAAAALVWYNGSNWTVIGV